MVPQISSNKNLKKENIKDCSDLPRKSFKEPNLLEEIMIKAKILHKISVFDTQCKCK
jgi:hypothetical protein